MNKTNAFDFLCRSAEGIAKMFGKYCETVVQEVIGQEIRIVAIYNGHVSGRKVGSTRSIYGDDVSADDFDFSKLSQDSYNQLVTLSNGKVIKSSSYYLRGADFTYILGINYDITLMEQIRNYAEDVSQTESDFLGSLQVKKENSLDALYEEALVMVNKPAQSFRKADRQTLIRLLNEKNFFGLSKCIPFLSEKLDVSKYTIYKDLNELEITSQRS